MSYHARRTWTLRVAASMAMLSGTFLAGCAASTSAPAGSVVPMVMAPAPDPRVGLKAGLQDAGSAIWNMQMVSHTPSPTGFAGVTNSDLGFVGMNVIQGNYNGFQIWDISNPMEPRIRVATLCPASQSDVTVYRNLLFVSAEAPSARLDCGTVAPRDPVSKDRIRGVRIFDITDIDHPKYMANVQTCRGSHTHTLVVDPKDAENVYIYISGTSGVRPADELAGCVADPNDPNTALFRIEVIRVPLAHPEQAAIISSPRIFADAATGAAMGLANPKQHGAPPLPPTANAADSVRYRTAMAMATLPPMSATSTHADTARYMAAVKVLADKGITVPALRPGRGGPNGITQCHDITVYPAVGLAGGACAGMGLLLDIHDVAHPRRIDAVADSNFSFWHSATFNNDGNKVLFSDEWGGGGAAYCRATDPRDWGADALFTIEKQKMHFKSYYKLPAPQTQLENCVAHNGSLIPIPGRDVMVQAWYQGGISVFDWTDTSHPREIAFFDRGPNDSTRAVGGGYWSAYWYNGHIIGSEMQRGLDIFELKAGPAFTQNEIDAAKLVHFDYLNVQGQPKFSWPADLVVARALLDQLNREQGLAPTRATAIGLALDRAQALSGAEKRNTLLGLASEIESDAKHAKDGYRTRWVMQIVRDVANATR